MKKMLLPLLLLSTVAYGSTKFRIVYPMDSPTEIMISEKLKEVAKKELDVDIEYVKVTNSELENKFITMERTGNGADLVITQDISNMKQYLEPVDDFKNKYNFNKGAVEYFSDNGKMLAVPVGMIVYGFMGNDFKADKVEDLYGKKTSIPNGTERHSFRNFYIYSIANGIGAMDIDSDKFKDVLELYKKVVVQDTHKTDKYPDMYKQYAENKVDFIHTGSYHTGNQKPWGLDNLSKSYPFIVGDKTYIGVTGPAISKSSKHKDIAKEIVDIYMRTEIINEKNTTMDIPAYDMVVDNSNITEDMARINKEWKRIADNYGVPLPKIENQGKIEKVYRDNIIMFLEGRQDVSGTISNIRKHINSNN
ncbi:MAG: ABC transporter substrate-binding protein [Bacteroidales bacterium]